MRAAMSYRFLCPRCYRQRTTNDHMQILRWGGKRLMARIAVGKCKECNGTGRYRCDVCGGAGEIDAHDPTAA